MNPTITWFTLLALCSTSFVKRTHSRRRRAKLQKIRSLLEGMVEHEQRHKNVRRQYGCRGIVLGVIIGAVLWYFIIQLLIGWW
jgi:hypothetical protein